MVVHAKKRGTNYSIFICPICSVKHQINKQIGDNQFSYKNLSNDQTVITILLSKTEKIIFHPKSIFKGIYQMLCHHLLKFCYPQQILVNISLSKIKSIGSECFIFQNLINWWHFKTILSYFSKVLNMRFFHLPVRSMQVDFTTRLKTMAVLL